ncbi:MAG: prepilin peptidase [Candidatus Nomurabacteria bacterium]|nr:prepilin peptidase [Candidatus Nomurabacteria bacterium]
MISLFAVVFFIFGLIIGSFLNVVIFRLNTKRSFGGRSGCMSCLNKLSWYELIPLFSFLGLKGRCRNCKSKISIQYPLVEFVTGIVFAFLFLRLFASGGQNSFLTLPFIITYTYYAITFSLLMVISVYDLRHKIIPDSLAFIFGALAFLGLFFFHGGNFYWQMPSILEFLSGFLIALPFAFFWFVSSGRWMGLGDAKLALGIGWLLGFVGALSGLVIAFWSGALVGICLIIFKSSKTSRLGMKSEIPFAPFLVFGAFLVFIFGLNLFGL